MTTKMPKVIKFPVESVVARRTETTEKLPELTKSLKETAYHIKQLMCIFAIESDTTKPNLPISKKYFKLEAEKILEKSEELIINKPESQTMLVIPDSLLTQIEIFQIMFAISSFNNRFIQSENIAAKNWLSQDNRSLKPAIVRGNDHYLHVSNIKQFQYHLVESVNFEGYAFNYGAINTQLEQVVNYLTYLSDTIDPDNPTEYFSDEIKRAEFKKCLGLVEFVMKMVKTSWDEYKVRCKELNIEPESKIANVVKTAINNFLTKLVYFDLPKAAGFEIPQAILDKYIKKLPPEIEALSPEDRADKNKLAQAFLQVGIREREERRNRIGSKKKLIKGR